MSDAQYQALLRDVNIVVAIDHARAGNGFFTTLFDQHRQVLACPAIHYLYSYIATRFGTRASFSRAKAIAFATTESYFKYIYGPENAESSVYFRKMGFSEQSRLDRGMVKSVFDTLFTGTTISRKELVVGIYYAYARAIGREIDRISHIFVSDCISLKNESIKGPFSARIIDMVIADFPHARLVHLVRDSRASFASFKQQYANQNGNMYGLRAGNVISQFSRLCTNRYSTGGKVGGGGCVFLFTYVYFNTGFNTLVRLKSAMPARFLTIRNEDLNLKPVDTLTGLCRWLGVAPCDDWAKADFTPTVFDMPWKGVGAYNSNYQTVTTGPLSNESPGISAASAGPNAHVVNRWRSRLSKSEIRLTEAILHAELTAHGYSLLFAQRPSQRTGAFLRSFLVPFRGEIPGLRWLRAGFKAGAGEALNRTLYYFAFPAFYLASRAVLCFLYARNSFGAEGAPSHQAHEPNS